MARKNVIERFRAYFKRLPELEKRILWDVLTALRGDDVTYSNEKLKVLTARIRYELLHPKLKSGSWEEWYDRTILSSSYMARKRPMTEKDMLESRELILEMTEHCRKHLRSAVVALGNAGCKVNDIKQILFEDDEIGEW